MAGRRSIFPGRGSAAARPLVPTRLPALQDFFDRDTPVALVRGDEATIPIAAAIRGVALVTAGAARQAENREDNTQQRRGAAAALLVIGNHTALAQALGGVLLAAMVLYFTWYRRLAS